MNQKGFSTLEALAGQFSEYIGFVVSARDAAVVNDFYEEIKDACGKNKIAFHNKSTESLPEVDYKIAIGWRWLIPGKEKLIVLHDSILPKYRGFTPLVNALIKGEKEIGVTAIWAAADFDAGEIIFQEKINISYPIKIQEAIEMVSALYQKICINIFKAVKANQPLASVPQEESKATFSIWRDAEDYRIDWRESATTIKRFIDALGFPYSGAQSLIENDQLIYIDCASVMDDINLEHRHIGKVIRLINGNPVVICGKGLLLIEKMRCNDGSGFNLKKLRVRFK
jgi:methionyl-tRNA formyltransferase